MSSTSTGAARPSGAFPPPPGVTPNLENPEDYLHTVNIVGLSICLGLIVIFFILRCYSRWHLALAMTAEDWASQISFALSVFYISTCFMMARYGEGYHAWEVTSENYRQLLKWLYASSIIWIPAAFAVKAALLLLTARVFAVYERAAKAIRLYVWFLLIAYAPIQGVKIFICTPIKHYWDPRVPGRCFDQPKIFLTDTAIAFITDFLILLIPIPLTWKLRMPLRKKMKIVAMLGAGGAAVAVACYREYKIYKFQWSTDVSGDFVVMNLCGTIELTIGMVCACLPPINLLVENWRRPIKSQNQSRTRFWPSRSTWQKESRSNCVTETSYLSTTIDNTPSRVNDAPNVSPGDDVESGVPSEACLDPPEPAVTSETGISNDLQHLELQELLRCDSQDGRREGWLVETSISSTGDPIERHEEPTRRQAQVTMEQLRQGGREILVPDRIWDGVRRSP